MSLPLGLRNRIKATTRSIIGMSYLWSWCSLLWCDFSAPLLSAARKSDATMQRTDAHLIDSETSLMPVCIDTPFFLLCITVPRLRIHNSCDYLYLSSVLLLLGLRVYATKWSHETNSKPRKVLDYHYLPACSFFIGLAEPKSNAFITIG